MDKINILHTINNLQVGGSEKFLVNLVNAMDDSRFTNYITYGGDSTLLNEFKYNIRVIKIYESTLSFTPKSLYLIPRFVDVIRKYNIDVVHAHLFDSGLLTSIAAKLNKTPVIYHVPGLLETQTKKQKIISRMPIFRKLINELYSVYIAGQKYSVQELINRWHVPEDKIKIIHHGIDIERFNPCLKDLRDEFNIDPGTPVLGFVGRLHPEKGIPDMLRIFKEVRKQINSKLIIVGDGEHRTKYEQLAIKFGIDNDVNFTGFRNDIPEVMKTFDVYFQTTHAPLIGTTVLEAMAVGKPIITLARNEEEVKMAMETVKPGVNGIIIPPDEKRAAEMICELLRDKDRLEEMGKESRKIVEEKFDFRDTVKKLERLYIELVNSRKRA